MSPIVSEIIYLAAAALAALVLSVLDETDDEPNQWGLTLLRAVAVALSLLVAVATSHVAHASDVCGGKPSWDELVQMLPSKPVQLTPGQLSAFVKDKKIIVRNYDRAQGAAAGYILENAAIYKPAHEMADLFFLVDKKGCVIGIGGARKKDVNEVLTGAGI